MVTTVANGIRVMISRVKRYYPQAGREVYWALVNGGPVNGGPDGTDMGSCMHIDYLAAEYKKKGYEVIKSYR